MDSAVLVLDGAAGTLLESQGVKLHPQLWSAAAISESPEALRELHRSYFAAGANIATAATYQASIEGYTSGLGLSESEAFLLLTRAVLLAKEEAAAASKPVVRFVAAGLGPYGAYLCEGQEYTGIYGLENGTNAVNVLRRFHSPRVAAVLAGDPDFLLFETVPNVDELHAIIDVCRQQQVRIPVWVSLSLKIPEDSSASVTLADGTSLAEVATILDPTLIKAVGANCFALSQATQVVDALQIFRRPLLLYPNSGEVYDGHTKQWSSTNESGEWTVQDWVQNGVRVVGGCCRTGPTEIKQIAQALGR